MGKSAAVKEEVTIKGALGRLGLSKAGTDTLAIAAHVETDLTPEQLWETWVELEKWPQWSKPLHISTRWLEEREWKVGAKFEQVRDLGFPFGKQLSIETVKEVNVGQSVSWWKSEKGISSCHIWFFEPLVTGGTAITNTEVFNGPTIGVFKMFVKSRWTALFQQSAQGLINATRARFK